MMYSFSFFEWRKSANSPSILPTSSQPRMTASSMVSASGRMVCTLWMYTRMQTSSSLSVRVSMLVLRRPMSSRSMGVMKALASLSVMPWRHLSAACSTAWMSSIHWGIRAGSKVRKTSFSICAALVA